MRADIIDCCFCTGIVLLALTWLIMAIP